MQRLPLDISTFSRLRELNYVYVDKTEYIYRMIMQGHRFFLSRPRRFGKSLLVSTLKEVLAANKILFHDLWIDKSDYQWKEHGVINLDFSTLFTKNLDALENGLCAELIFIAKRYSITIEAIEKDPIILLKKIVHGLYEQYGNVAILVDEYDSPILKNLYNEELAKEIRNFIQQFFTVIKGLDQYVQFVFITGVTSFAKAGLFSGINNLQIVTLRDEFGAICGYTDEEVDHYFHEYMTQWAQKSNITFDTLRSQIKQWYNGYCFGENTQAVYNPFSLMNALAIEKFENFWFQSGIPKFLVEVLKRNENSYDLAKFMIHKDSLTAANLEKINLLATMFYAGGITIIDYNSQSQFFTLDYPNEETRVTFQKYLFEVFILSNQHNIELSQTI